MSLRPALFATMLGMLLSGGLPDAASADVRLWRDQGGQLVCDRQRNLCYRVVPGPRVAAPGWQWQRESYGRQDWGRQDWGRQDRGRQGWADPGWNRDWNQGRDWQQPRRHDRPLRERRFTRQGDGVVCDGRTSICYKNGHIDKSETQDHFGNGAARRADAVRDRAGTGQVFVPRPGVVCDRDDRSCIRKGGRGRD